MHSMRVVYVVCHVQPEPPQVDLGQLGVFKSIHHSIRLRSRHPTALATLTENALKKVYYHVSSVISQLLINTDIDACS